MSTEDLQEIIIKINKEFKSIPEESWRYLYEDISTTIKKFRDKMNNRATVSAYPQYIKSLEFSEVIDLIYMYSDTYDLFDKDQVMKTITLLALSNRDQDQNSPVYRDDLIHELITFCHRYDKNLLYL
ncbi:MAG: hypothetical protein LBT51_06135 [Fusobacteriaceae bacterium]|jgi:hypothetical protein|nr:hypothetical protein [Fusobacteriaceae bacterium]